MVDEIEIPAPEWNSNLARIILDLEKLRNKRIYGEVPPYIFFQLKNIFQILETLGSARIEGNNTTLSEYVEKIIDDEEEKDETYQELLNIDRATEFIEQTSEDGIKIDRSYISQLHNIVTEKLTPPPKGEGSNYPGELRPHDVRIKKSGHEPTAHTKLQEAFEKFILFINNDMGEQNQLLMVAIAHHRFMYFHPFDNGNGRMGRLLTYAFLLNLGFRVSAGGRIINPSAIFYTDRDKYYEMLGIADSLEQDDILKWSEYFLLGLKNQIEKIDSLLEVEFTKNEILVPAIKRALERENITKQEFEILSLIIKSEKMCIKTSDLSKIGVDGTDQKTYIMQKMKDKKMVQPLRKGGRIYTIHFANNYLLRSVIKTLKDKGFVADFLNN